MERDTIIQTLLEEKILVIVRGVAPEKLLPLAEALYAGGIRVMEVTYSADGSVDDAAAARCVQQLAAHFGERMLIGSGTVLKPEQVRRTAAAGFAEYRSGRDWGDGGRRAGLHPRRPDADGDPGRPRGRGGSCQAVPGRLYGGGISENGASAPQPHSAAGGRRH